jgi:hypothetical protein
MLTCKRFALPTCFVVIFGVAETTALADGPQYGFIVNVSVSPKAATRLAALKEKITVAADYEGFPVPSKMNKAGEMGQIGLGGEAVTIPGTGGRATITGKNLKMNRISWVKDVQVLINVFSARLSGPDNILDCSIFEDSVSKAQRMPVNIRCGLIEEM